MPVPKGGGGGRGGGRGGGGGGGVSSVGKIKINNTIKSKKKWILPRRFAAAFLLSLTFAAAALTVSLWSSFDGTTTAAVAGKQLATGTVAAAAAYGLIPRSDDDAAGAKSTTNAATKSGRSAGDDAADVVVVSAPPPSSSAATAAKQKVSAPDVATAGAGTDDKAVTVGDGNGRGDDESNAETAAMVGESRPSPGAVFWQTMKCTRIVEDAAYRKLPKGGVLYRLGNIPNRSATQFLALSGAGTAAWDMLWSDFSGAFDQEKAPNATLFVPWRNPHVPIFLVAYSSEPVEVNVVHAADERTASPADRSSECAQHLRTAARAVGYRVSGDSLNRSWSDHSVQVVNTEEIFRYPVRKPFFRRRKSRSGIVTICTQMTVERFKRLIGMAQAFAGPISAVVYVGFRGNTSAEVAQISQIYGSSDVMQEYVDVHLVYDDKKPWYATGITAARGINPYPINWLRQYAVDRATTDWVLYLEGDMTTVPNAHGIIAKSWDGMMQLHQHNETAVFVVPIFFYGANSSQATKRLPTDKTELMAASGTFKRFWYDSHRGLNYDDWEKTTDGSYIPYHKSGDPDAILRYQQEPYYIVRRRDMPPYNVLFAGMGQDKETQLRDTNACGFQFFLHPELFVVDFPQPKKVSPGWVTWAKPWQTWRQVFVHSMHEAYKQEVQKAMITSGRTAFKCGSEGLRSSTSLVASMTNATAAVGRRRWYLPTTSTRTKKTQTPAPRSSPA